MVGDATTEDSPYILYAIYKYVKGTRCGGSDKTREKGDY